MSYNGDNKFIDVQRIEKKNWNIISTESTKQMQQLLKYIKEDKEEDVGSYWMTLRKGEDAVIWKRKLWIALCGELALEETLDLS